VGAYFGEVVKNLCANGENTVVSPYVFLQAYGHIVKDATHSLNGDTSQAAWHFLTELLTRLDLEATMGADKGHGPLSLVKDLFNVTTATKVSRRFRSSFLSDIANMLEA